jgi:thiamine biosynthesis lipoprotein
MKKINHEQHEQYLTKMKFKFSCGSCRPQLRCYAWFYILILIAILSSCEAGKLQRSDFVIGTICRIRFFEAQKPDVFNAVFSELHRLDDMLSANKDGTEIDTINKNAGIKAVDVSDELIEVLSTALRYAELSSLSGRRRAAFDPTIGPLVKLWGIGNGNEKVPPPEEISAALSLVDYRNVELGEHSVYLKQKGMMLDLGAIAKGYAADRAAVIITGFGIERAIIDFGGNIVVLGEKKDKKPYKIGIQNPSAERGEFSGYVEVDNVGNGKKTLVTSGVYERFFEEDGTRYHHILSTETVYPVQNDIDSVTIITDKSMDADALSTTLFALGYEEGIALLNNMERGTDAIFIFRNGAIKHTPNVNYFPRID